MVQAKVERNFHPVYVANKTTSAPFDKAAPAHAREATLNVNVPPDMPVSFRCLESPIYDAAFAVSAETLEPPSPWAMSEPKWVAPAKDTPSALRSMQQKLSHWRAVKKARSHEGQGHGARPDSVESIVCPTSRALEAGYAARMAHTDALSEVLASPRERYELASMLAVDHGLTPTSSMSMSLDHNPMALLLKHRHEYLRRERHVDQDSDLPYLHGRRWSQSIPPVPPLPEEYRTKPSSASA